MNIPDHWCWATIAEVQSNEKRSTITGPFGSSIGKKFFVEHGVPVIRGNNLSLGSDKFKDEGFVFVSEGKAEELQGYKAFKNDLIFTAAGTIGQVGIIPEKSKYEFYIISNKQMRARFDADIVDPMFAYYWFSSPWMVDFIKRHDTGSTIPLINLGVLRALPMPLPPLAEQITIRQYLCTIDDKINNNRNINQTLEQMAQALFKSWFVDFEPVKAKMAVLEAGGSQEDATLAAMTVISGKDADALAVFEREHPEHYAELKATAELFPCAMQDSELGGIPEGWHVTDLSEVASLNAESWSKKNVPESVSYVDLANTKWGVINAIETYQFSDAPSRARRILKPHDTIVGTVRPGNGSYSYINKTGLTGSTGFAVLTPKTRVFSEYIYLCVTSNESIERLAHLADGGAYPAVNADVVLSTQCVLPVERDTREAVLKVFSSRTDMFFSYRANGLSQNEMLSNIRDTLLPKLLSGEITLPEAEQAINEAENV